MSSDTTSLVGGLAVPRLVTKICGVLRDGDGLSGKARTTAGRAGGARRGLRLSGDHVDDVNEKRRVAPVTRAWRLNACQGYPFDVGKQVSTIRRTAIGEWSGAPPSGVCN